MLPRTRFRPEDGNRTSEISQGISLSGGVAMNPFKPRRFVAQGFFAIPRAAACEVGRPSGWNGGLTSAGPVRSKSSRLMPNNRLRIFVRVGEAVHVQVEHHDGFRRVLHQGAIAQFTFPERLIGRQQSRGAFGNALLQFLAQPAQAGFGLRALLDFSYKLMIDFDEPLRAGQGQRPRHHCESAGSR